MFIGADLQILKFPRNSEDGLIDTGKCVKSSWSTEGSVVVMPKAEPQPNNGKNVNCINK